LTLIFMYKKSIKISGILVGLMFFGVAAGALAHQPRLVFDQEISADDPVVIKNPEISQAYYGKLKGAPDYYQIAVEKDFDLYVNILVPAEETARPSFSISRGGEVFFLADGQQTDWEPFFEKFAGDNYLQGAEFKLPVGAGEYEVKVFSTDNYGRYALAVGQREKFGLGEIVKTLVALPKLKTAFFGQSVWEAYFNQAGLYLGVLLLAIAGPIILVVWLINKIKKQKRGRAD